MAFAVESSVITNGLPDSISEPQADAEVDRSAELTCEVHSESQRPEDSIIFEIEGRLLTLPKDYFKTNAEYFRGTPIDTRSANNEDQTKGGPREICKIGINDFLVRLYPSGPQPVEPASEVVTPVIEPTRDPIYYLDTAIFEVETHHFAVLKYHFLQSTIFDSYGGLDWIDDDHPIKLDGILKSDFEALWKLLYPLSQNTLSQDEQESVLKLSTKWRMLPLRKTVVRNLNSISMTPSKRIFLGREYKVVKWLRSAYIDLVTKVDAWSIEEFRSLGLENALILSQKVRRPQRYRQSGSSISPSKNVDTSFQRAIDDAFGFPLDTQTQTLDEVSRILLAQSSGVPEWLYAAYGDLAKREQDITVAEAERLGVKTTLSLCRLRERIDCQNSATPGLIMWGRPGDEVGDFIDVIFRQEFEEVRKEGMSYGDPFAVKSMFGKGRAKRHIRSS